MYLYHAVRQDLVGNNIVPLGELCKTSEELYSDNENMSRLPNQYRLQNQKIEILNCEKRDVVFLTAIEPKVFGEEFKRRTGATLKGSSFYKININDLDLDKLCIYFTYEPEEAADFIVVDEDVIQNFEKYQSIPQDAKDFWETMKLNDPRTGSLLFSGTYLFLYKGRIAVDKAEIIIL